jgi:Glycosyltransferase
MKALDENAVFYYWIDHTVNCSTNTGMQRVVRWLARAMIENGEEIVFVKWDGHDKRLILATQSDLQKLSLWSGPILPEDVLIKYPADGAASVEPEPIGTRRGWLFVPEVAHITFHSEAPTLDAISCAKALGLKVAFIFYDAVPLKVEGYAESREAHAAYMQHIAVADALLPISQFASDDLVSFYVERHGFTSETMPYIVAVPLPGENYDAPRVHRSVDTSSSMILCVGTIEPRKNQTLLIAAFNRLVQRHPELPLRLVLVGNLHPMIAPLLHKAIVENSKIEYLQYVSDHDLWRLYGECAFSVFPSLEEGFGLPIIESLWHGKPCICANFGAMAETADGGGCLAVNVRSLDEVTEAMERLLVDMELRSRLTAEAMSRSIKTWGEYAKELVNSVNGLTKPKIGAITIYYWVDQTCQLPINTGVQRVVRAMAKALKEAGARLIPVKWNQSEACFNPPSPDELSYLSRWNGLRAKDWDPWIVPSMGDANWLLVPEVTTLTANLDQVAACAEVHGLKKAAIFYDAIPYKMTDLYPPEFGNGHANYMRSLLRFDKIFSISEFSQNDLAEFFYGECDRLINIDDKLLAIPLPGEFPESDRVNAYREPNSRVIRILCVGRVEPRKNHLALIEAFLIVLRRTTRLVALTIAGDSLGTPDLENRVSANCSNHAEICWLRSVGDAELARLYSECHFSVFPSVEEGFGLPILESLWHARPCICRNSGAMVEVAEGGGCLTVDTTDINALADAILELVENDALRHQLGEQAIGRSLKTWRHYADEILHEMGCNHLTPSVRRDLGVVSKFQADQTCHPRLSLCVTTYNRASWLAISLENLFCWVRPWSDSVEIVVCDNASTDSTPDVVKPYFGEKNFRYYRNPVNVGMLGNLRVTAHHSKGQYVWLLGDDDLIRKGAIERVLRAIEQHPAVGLIYLNYAYTRISEAEKVGAIDQFLSDATPIVRPSLDRFATIKEISTLSENFFTAIYCLVFRRDHALRAYSQDTSGRAFSSLLTCIPTSFYVCQNMFNEMGYWVGEPCVVVNMNVSWGKFAPLWILERIPELYDLAEKKGANPDEMDNWRRHTLEGAIPHLERIFADDPEGNLAYFSMDRWIRHHKHLEEFRARLPKIMDIYARAFRLGIAGASESPEQLLDKFGLLELLGSERNGDL